MRIVLRLGLILALAILLLLYSEIVLILCVALAVVQSAVRWCPEIDRHDGRTVIRTRSNLHRRYRLPRWLTDYPVFLTLPRLFR